MITKALWNIFDSDGALYAVEKWEWSVDHGGYKIETQYKQGFQDRDWNECTCANMAMKRELVSDNETFEFDTTALSKEDQLQFMMLLNSGVKIKVVSQE